MKISKSAQASARRIFQMCSPDGKLDENLLRKAVTKIVESKPRGYKSILAGVARLLRREEQRRRVMVETARFLDPSAEEKVRKSLTEKYGEGLIFEFRINPDLLGGMKVRIGDDVIDGSVASRIKRLEQAFQ